MIHQAGLKQAHVLIKQGIIKHCSYRVGCESNAANPLIKTFIDGTASNSVKREEESCLSGV